MPEIGFFELCLIGIVMFLVLGPERMPEFFALLGKLVRTARRWMAEVRDQWQAAITAPVEDKKEHKPEDQPRS